MDDLRCSYPGRTGRAARQPVTANSGISLQVARGEVFGVLGPNGAGKSTLVRQLIGLMRPDSGSIRLFGHDVVAHPRLPPRFVAYLAQEEQALDELPVGIAVATTGRLRGMSKVAAHTQTRDLLDELDLSRLGGRAFKELSGGERRLAGVACALVADRPVLILDEPTTGMDPAARRSVWAALDRRRAQHGVTVVVVTHNVVEAESFLDTVAVLDAGRVVACDTPGRLKAMVSEDVRLDVVWRYEPPSEEPAVRALQAVSEMNGRRWSARLSQSDARTLLGQLTAGPAFAALDDFTLATPSLEDVYLALGGHARDMERV